LKLPSYEDFMYPLLEWAGDGQVYSMKDAYQAMAARFGLTAEQREQLTASGTRLVDGRVGWAKTYLVKAGLLESAGRGKIRITERGLSLIKEEPVKGLDKKLLMRYPEFQTFVGKPAPQSVSIMFSPADPDKKEADPVDELRLQYRLLKRSVMDELLERLRTGTPSFFEKVVVDLMVAMGYGGDVEEAAGVLGRTGDGGVDGVIKEDVLGLDMIYVQAKRWANSVMRPEIQKFAGSLEGMRAKKGVFITTSTFSNGAREYVDMIEKKIVLIDGEQLVDYMFRYGLGVSPSETFVVKRVGEDYFAGSE